MLWVILISALLLLFAALLLLRIRLRFEFGPEKRLLFVGLGHSGPQIDFVRKEGAIQLRGIVLKRFDTGRKKPVPAKPKAKKKPTPRKPKPSRHRPPRDIVRVARRSLQPLWHFVVRLLKAVVVEELHGRVAGGFAAPDLTGMTYGFYQAALGVAPNVVGRIQYLPDYAGPSLSGSGQVAVALPLYALVWRLVILLGQLPLRDIIRLAIGKKKGAEDVQQRSRDTQRRRRRAA